MNRERLIDLADRIEKLPDRNFCMRNYTDHCGLPSCVAGWAVYWYAPDKFNAAIEKGWCIHEIAAELLELNDIQANALFCPIIDCGAYDAGPGSVANVIRRLANDTGGGTINEIEHRIWNVPE